MNEREYKLDPLARMREMDAAGALEPPTEAESFDYVRVLREAQGPLPRRRGGLLYWVLIFATFAFLSGAVFQASRAEGQSSAVSACISALVFDINTSLMSPTGV